MANINFTITSSLSVSGGSPYSGSQTYAGNTQEHIDVSIAASQTKHAVSCSFLTASVVSLFILADQNCTLYTNNSGSPVETVSLLANVPVTVNPFGQDVTSWFITTGGSITRVRADILTN